MFRKKEKFSIQKIIPISIKIAEDTAKGYVFGSVFGAFAPGSYSVASSMHRSGKVFAKMSAVFSATEMALGNIREKDIYSSIVAGSMAGMVSSKEHKLMGAALFGLYSGVSEYIRDLSPK